MTRRKNFGERCDRVLSACAIARGIQGTVDVDADIVRTAVIRYVGEVEAIAKSGRLKSSALPSCAQRHLYKPLRQFFSDHISDHDVRLISRMQPVGARTLANIKSKSHAQLKRNIPAPLLPLERLFMFHSMRIIPPEEHAFAEIANVVDYVVRATQLGECVHPARRKDRNIFNSATLEAVERTERTRNPERYCYSCHLPSQQYQALYEYVRCITRPGLAPIELFFLNRQTTARVTTKVLTTRMSPEYCDLHAGSSNEACARRRYTNRYAAEIANEMRNFHTSAPVSSRDMRMVRMLRAQPAPLHIETPRIRAGLMLFRQHISDLVNYYIGAMPIPSSASNEMHVDRRFARVKIHSDGHLTTLDFTGTEIARYSVAHESTMTLWRESFESLKSLRDYLPSGIVSGDDVWITCADPGSNGLRLPIANICLNTELPFVLPGKDKKLSWRASPGQVLEITTLSTEWLKLSTSIDVTRAPIVEAT